MFGEETCIALRNRYRIMHRETAIRWVRSAYIAETSFYTDPSHHLMKSQEYPTEGGLFNSGALLICSAKYRRGLPLS